MFEPVAISRVIRAYIRVRSEALPHYMNALTSEHQEYKNGFLVLTLITCQIELGKNVKLVLLEGNKTLMTLQKRP